MHPAACQKSAPQKSAPAPYLPLQDGSPVSLHRNACVQLRSRYAECGYCEKICPVSALRVGNGAISVSGECLGCGRCKAACPTGALQVAGFSPSRFSPSLESLAHGRSAVRVECSRGPKGADVRVPCLGGLSSSCLLALRLAAGEREIELLDRGWCADCPAARGAKEHPAGKSLARVQARLLDAGVPERLVPRLASAPLPASRSSPVKRLAPNAARRSLMTRFTRALQEEHTATRFFAAPAPERERILGGLAKLAARYGGRVSEKLFHTVEVNLDCCQAHGVCAAGCPTGALRAEAAGEGTHALTHSSALCIGCGHCERVCPEKALRLVYGAGSAAVVRRVVAKFESAECERCGAEIALSGARRGSRTVCERCAKSSALARAAFQQLHGSRVVDGA